MLVEILKKAYNVMLYPQAMLTKESRRHVSSQMLSIYVGVLALLPAISLFIENSFVIVMVNNEPTKEFIVNGRIIGESILYIALLIGAFWLISFLIHIFSKPFVERRDFINSLKVVAFALTPLLISPIFGFIPVFAEMLAIFLLIYGGIILLMGVKKLIQPTRVQFFMYLMSLLFFFVVLLIAQLIMELI